MMMKVTMLGTEQKLRRHTPTRAPDHNHPTIAPGRNPTAAGTGEGAEQRDHKPEGWIALEQQLRRVRRGNRARGDGRHRAAGEWRRGTDLDKDESIKTEDERARQ